MKTREVAQMCGVSEWTVSGNARKAGVVLENGKTHDWTEEEVKRIQLVLMANAQNNNVNASEVVKETSKTVFELGTLANVALTSGNIEAAEQFSKLLIQATTATAQAKQLEVQNRQLQNEVDKYVQWMSASQIKKEYNLPTRPGVTKVAQLLGLKRGEDWIEKSYGDDTCYSKVLYSPEAVQLIVGWYFED